MNEDTENTSTDVMVVDWDKEFAVSTQEMLRNEKPAANFISFRAGVISYDGNSAPGNKINVVVIGSAFENNYYPHRFDPNKIRSPDCWAIGLTEEDLAPSADKVTDLQYTSCEGCPQNEWGSDPNGGKGKGCKNIRRLAVVPSYQLDNPTLVAPLLAKLPVTSVANWRKYVEQIGNLIRRPFWAVETEISTAPDAKSQFKVNFAYVRSLVPEELTSIKPWWDTYGTDPEGPLMTGYSPNDDEPEPEPAPATTGTKGKPKF